jgi:acyl-CoA synthetase (AMP-forming)/AMP-acid ligase II
MTESMGLGLDANDSTPLIGAPDVTLTRGQLKARADELAGRLQAEGLARIMMRSDDPADILRAMDAASQASVDLWVAHTTLPDDVVATIATDFAIELLVGPDDIRLTPTHRPGREPGSPRIHMMTSGTTGAPKMAVHTLESLLHRVRPALKAQANAEGRWLLTYQPTGFAGVQVALTAVLTRGILVVPRTRTPAGFLETAVKWGVTQISGTPTFWRSFLMVVTKGALNLRQITMGGEAIDQATLDRVGAKFPEARITHIYASTEAGVVFAVHDGLEGFPRAWLDEPVQGVELRVVDDLLQIRTPNAMHGYLKHEDQPLQADGWLRTADRCELTDDRVRILGRQDSTINVGGSKVYPQAVETVLLKLPQVVEARVYAVPNPISGHLVGADVVLESGTDADQARKDILAACRAGLSGYQVPRAFKIVDSIVVAASGKKG